MKSQLNLSTEPIERELGRDGGIQRFRSTGHCGPQWGTGHTLSREQAGRTQLWSATSCNVLRVLPPRTSSLLLLSRRCPWPPGRERYSPNWSRSLRGDCAHPPSCQLRLMEARTDQQAPALSAGRRSPLKDAGLPVTSRLPLSSAQPHSLSVSGLWLPRHPLFPPTPAPQGRVLGTVLPSHPGLLVWRLGWRRTCIVAVVSVASFSPPCLSCARLPILPASLPSSLSSARISSPVLASAPGSAACPLRNREVSRLGMGSE